MLNPLQPVVTSANAKVSKADAEAYLAALLALTPLPAGKTADQVLSYTVRKNQASGELTIAATFKS